MLDGLDDPKRNRNDSNVVRCVVQFLITLKFDPMEDSVLQNYLLRKPACVCVCVLFVACLHGGVVI